MLTLYDPDRSQSTRRYGTPTSWEAFQMAITGLLEELRTTRGEGFRLLMGAFTSPTLEAQCRTLLARYPKARIHTHEPGGRDQVHAGCQMAFGRPAQPVYHLNQATRILALDADFLVDEPGSVRYARDFAAGRRPGEGQHEPNRLFVAECTPSVTGVQADHRVLLKSGAMEALARAVLAGIQGSGEAAPPAGIPAPWLQAVVADLKGAGAHGLVIAGSQQSAVVHALTGAINSALGSIGTTVTYTAPVEVLFGNPGDSLKELVQDIGAGKVKTLVILGCNPAYSAPADLQMAEALQRVPLRIHMGLYDDETASLCHWHVPQTHYLESWSDIRAYDGTASLVQPLIEPLYECHSPHELLALLTGVGPRPPYELVREHWMRMWGMAVPGPAAGPAGSPMRADSGPRLVPSDAFESRWHEALNKGVIAGTAARAFAGLAARVPPVSAPAAAGPELLFRLDPTIRAGQFANNGWLQELPKCFTALTWDNALLLSPADLRSRNLT
ncbi:MAG: molybdopterin oxidoreductase, partial [Armatimonadetes bacterium]|nr:molybdopterin oxidoreductase [Armatimonadota bacterium]